MSYLEKLKNSRKRPQVAFQEFVLYTAREKSGLFCFFEGKDNAYYVPRIKKYTESYHPIKCGGRDAVLDVYRLIVKHKEYDKYHKAFFIDQDFNPPLPEHNPPIFETPCYSIENLYVSVYVYVFKEILKNALHLSAVSEDYKICVDLYENTQDDFHKATLLFNAWYACLISKRNALNQETGVNLDDKFPRNFIDVKLTQVTKNYDLNRIMEKYPKSLAVDANDLDEKMREFSTCEQHKVFRGKYELEFLIFFIGLLIKDSRNTKYFVQQNLDFSFNDALNNQRALEVFSIYAETPSNLDTYLQQVTELFTAN